ncbi:long-chain-fatty-acid--CoA ligase [Thermobispora bispora]|jgi:long-chain acyl-CoA synthetase|uniref:long-chain-fatty-acid--CoA ligase n=1 Tax=Thermobispora bispora TaxID=2006 RepID=UPI00197D8059|nr:long-chain fatty acid--CoA ligase [Thermobispora bispora]MBO2474312.1 long-chain-fatty-acid--CoA ligase [Actinomycetales bacterium]MBX6167578.1 long-chain fatty acid--CoA ligase [Thermobispora bispora]MDI9580191.1 long-chain fatty acid--CoA ligase [Thermobispora sp.]QSI48849.1 long-chain fatty acid--CoA ligase [Thermobispora bispora]
MLNLAVVLEDSARVYPDRTALVYGDLRVPYSLVNTLANQVANLLVSRGIRKGDKVALLCPNLPYFPFVYFGILKAGATAVPLNVLLQSREITYHLTDSDAKALFCFEGTPELPIGERGRAGFEAAEVTEHFIVLPATPFAKESQYGETLWAAIEGMSGEFSTVTTAADDTAVILYTSGTTGQPKGAELTHQNMLMNAMVSDEMFPRGEDDVYLTVLPLFHSFGQTVMMNAGFRRHATLVLMPRFEPVEALKLMEQEKVTLFAGVPTMYWAMLTAVHTGQASVPSALRTVVSGGASLPVEVLKDFKETFGLQILEGYGLSETSPVASFNQLGRPAKPGSIGTPIWGVEMKLVDADWNEVDDVGEIAIRGHNVMKGYYKRPEATAEVMKDGWFRTGDIARRDEDGYYYIIDRAKDMIIRGGFNVYPREVEEVLMTHPAVSLAAVVGVPHESHGEEIKAFIIRKPGAEVTEEELIAWAKENMAAYKYPRIIEFRDSLPMTATGKILKRELR